MRAKTVLVHLAALAGYTALAFFFCRPLGAHLLTRLLGPGGDASVTLWNIWHFRDAVTHGVNPFWTDFQYWPSGGNLIMHQYTLFTDIFSFPLVPLVGVIAAYNIHMLVCLVLAGYLLFLMARDFGTSDGPAFVAGSALAFSPFIGAVIDSGDGVCYQIMWPAVLFFWMLARAIRDGKMKDCLIAALALTVQWAYSYYYVLYCVLMAGVFYLVHESPVRLEFNRRSSVPKIIARSLDAFCAVAGLWALYAAIHGQREFHGAGSAKLLIRYVAPYMSLWAALGLRAVTRWTAKPLWNKKALEFRALKPYAATLSAYAALNLPLIGAILAGMRSGDYGTAPAPWRGGGNPTDILEMILPDAANPLWGGALRHLYDALRMHPASISALGVAPLAAVYWLWTRRTKDRWETLWFASFAFSFIFTLGPWLKVYGVHTYLPLPFYPIHLLPFFNNIQHGLRFIAFTSLFMALLIGRALDRMRSFAPKNAVRWVVPVAFAVLALEYAPPRRELSTLEAPPIVTRLGDRPYGALLTLPVGANFNGISGAGWRGHMAVDLALQYAHRKPIVGGYLARVPVRAYHLFVDDPFLAGLVASQDSGTPPSAVTDPKSVERSLRDLRVRYVLVDRSRITAELAAAVSRWPLTRLDAEDRWSLYETTVR